MKINILNKIFTAKKIAVDFGTANCVIIIPEKGIVLNEPTVVAISPKEKKVLAVGQEAKEMLGKVPEGIDARRPLRSGGISNFRLAQALLKKFFGKIIGKLVLIKPTVIVSVPTGLNSVEERALTQAFNSVGAGKIYLLPESIAAAVGAKMPIHLSLGNMIVNLGGGTAEIAVLSLNGVVAYESHKGSGDAINEAIIDFIKRKFNLLIGELTAENLKIRIGSALEVRSPIEIALNGKNSKTGQPQTLRIGTNDIVEPIRGVLDEIVNAIKKVLAKTPPELMSDIIDNGIVLSGGTSLLRNIDELLSKSLNIPVTIVEDPLTCVVRGLEIVLNNMEGYKRSVRG